MTQAQITQIAAAVAAVLSGAKPSKKAYPSVKKHVAYKAKSAAPEDSAADRQMARLAKIARDFGKMGVNVTFDKATGRFDNVKPYKVWLAEGRVVRKGQHGVSGLFHVSQTDALDVPSKAQMTAEVVALTQPVA